MISISVNTREFSQILPDECFNVDAPAVNPPIATSSLGLTRTEQGLMFSVVEQSTAQESVSVENTLEEVIARSRRDVEIHDRNIRSLLNLALALVNGGKLDEAVALLEEVLVNEPKNYVALTSLALIFFKRGELRMAAETYSRQHLAYPADPAPLINLASIALREQDFIRANEYLEKAVALDGCSIMAKYLSAMVLLRLGKHNRSIALLRASLRESGPSAELNQGLAIAYLVAGDLKRAERAFSTALAINNHMASAVHGLALLRLQQHRLDEVVESLLDHLSRDSKDLQARELIARAYVELGQFSRARGQLSVIMSVQSEVDHGNVELARISNNIGFCFASEGKSQDAELWLKRSLDLDGKSSAAPYTNLGRMYLSQGRFREALALLLPIKDSVLATPDSSLVTSAALINLQRGEDAIVVLQSLIDKGNAPPEAYAELGWLLSDWKEEYDAALLILREGFAKYPFNSIVLNNLAYVHLMRGEPAFARAVLDQIKDASDNPILLTATRGLLLLWEGDIDGGEKLYKQAETSAFQSGMRDFAISIRQKRHLEMTRAYLRAGRIADALKQQQSGLALGGGQRFYRFTEQLLEIGRQLNSGTQTPLVE
jgi:tetratricopeptide (TPR) repeat protein